MADQEPSALPPDSNGPRIEHDLRAIREARGLSLDALQRETRMPGDILRRFEAGELVGDANYNEVYLRNLLKTYAQALGISPQEVGEAFEQSKSGSYDGSLRRTYLEGDTPEPPAPTPEKPPKSTSSGTAPAVAALSEPPKEKDDAPPVAERTAEHLPKRRVQSAKASSATPLETSWGLILGGTVVAVLVIGAVLWFLLRDPGPEPEIAETPPAPADTAQAEAPTDTAAAPVTPPPTDAPSFQTPIQLTVTAADEPLENFRVQVDDDARRPHWVEPGASTSFTAEQRIAVWGELEQGAEGGGQYDGAVLRLQGVEWTPSDGQVVRISAQTGQAVLDSLAR